MSFIGTCQSPRVCRTTLLVEAPSTVLPGSITFLQSDQYRLLMRIEPFRFRQCRNRLGRALELFAGITQHACSPNKIINTQCPRKARRPAGRKELGWTRQGVAN